LAGLFKGHCKGIIIQTFSAKGETMTSEEERLQEEEPCRENRNRKTGPGSRLGEWGRDLGDRVDDYFHSARSGRLTSSAFAIAWSLVAFIALFFFNRYIAYYEYITEEGVSRWVRTPVLTGDFQSWLPVAGVALGLTVIGHIILIVYDTSCYGTSILRQTVLMVLNLVGITAVLVLLKLFPFDFSGIPHQALVEALPIVAVIALMGIAAGLTIATIVQFVRLIVALAR